MTGRNEKNGKEPGDLESMKDRVRDLETDLTDSRDLMDSMRDPVLVLDADLRVVSANRAYSSTFELSLKEVEGKLLVELGGGQWDIPELLGMLNEVLEKDTTFDAFEVDREFEKTGSRIMLLNARRIDRGPGKPHRIVLVMEDATVSRLIQYAVEESEVFHRAILESVSDAVFLADDSGRIVYVGGNVQEIFKKSTQEIQDLGNIEAILGKDLFDPETLSGKGEIANIEREVTDASGQKRTLLISVKRVAFRQGTVLYNCRDYTEGKEQESRLSEALAQLGTIFAHAPVAMMLVDRERRVTEVNGSAARFAGRTAEEMIGLRGGEALRCLHHLDDPQGCGSGQVCKNCQVRLAVLDTFRDKKSREQIETCLPFPANGGAEERCLSVSTAYLEYDGNGRVLVCVQDITERVRAEEALRESEAKYRRIADNVTDVVFTTDLNFNTTYISPSIQKLIGVSPQTYLQMGLEERLPPQTIKKFQNILIQELEKEKDPAVGRGRTIVVEGEHYKPDGSTINISMHVSFIRDEKGIPIGILGVTRDITERKRAEAEREKLQSQLLQAQRLESVGRLAGGVAHDFNNMLSVILGYGENLLHQLHPGDPLREDVKEIVEAGKRSAALIRQLLAFSRKQTLQPEVLDLNKLLQDLENMLHRLIGEDIELKLALSDKIGRVMADPGQVEQVIMNLAVNARDAMPGGGKLMIETADVELDEDYASTHAGVTPGKYVMLAVTDNGSGMDRETLSNVFEPFFTTKEKGKGTGLGLSTVYGIVKQSGGNIWAYSEPGLGTTFKIYLPQTEAEPKGKAKAAKKETTKGAGEKILVVEDNENLRNLMATMLSRLGYKVTLAANGGEALLLMEKKGLKPDLVITDVVMPKMSGKELADRLREIHPDLKVLYMSGYTDNAIAHHGILDPGIPFIQKPFTLGDIAQKVRAVLQGD